MKKWLIFLISLFSILIGINSVSAEELNTSNLFNYIHFTNMYGMTDDEMLLLGTSVGVDLTDFVKNYNIHKDKLTLKNFIFRYDGGTGITIFYKSNDTWTINLKDNSTYYSLYVEDRNTASKVSVKYNSWSGTTFYSPSQSAYTLGQLSNIKKDVAKEYYFFYISDLEEDIYLTYTASLYGSGWLTNDITIDNNIYSINDSTPINLKTGYHSLKDTKPKIDMNLIESYDNFTKIKISFSTFDNQKYLYFLSTDRKNWIDIMENDYEYTSYVNGVLYVIVVDRDEFYESADQGIVKYDPIVSATWTFTGINEIMPEAQVFFQTPDSCKITNKGKEYIICRNLYVEISNYNSIEKYMWQYSFDRENWLSIYTNKFNIEFSENKTVYFKLINPSTKEEYKYFTATITGIVSLPNDLKAYIDMFGEYNKETFSFNIDTYIYNYDSSIYNYFYSIDGINWTELKDSNMLTTSNSLVRHIVLEFYRDLTLYVKVEDKKGNYIHAATYTITYFSKSDVKSDTLDSFDSNSNLVSQVFKPFLEIWNNFKTYSKIFNYLLYVILGSIILLLLKSIRK